MGDEEVFPGFAAGVFGGSLAPERGGENGFVGHLIAAFRFADVFRVRRLDG